MNSPQDTDILEACRRGDRAAFNQLVRLHQDRIFRVVRRMIPDADDAWDVAQEVFIRAYEKVAEFRGDAQVSTWLYRIAVNLSLNHIRRSRLRRFLRIDDGEHTLQDDGPSPSANIERMELRQLVERAIETLPKKQKAVFVLRYHEELPYEKIAAVLGTSVGGLKANYHHAVRKIEAYVKEHL
ncbi:MAG: sigma-70 family RNA polymerase sigma factor [Bacteroidetes bacterium]|nr:sigma-70 family RNA polymerase sigma factor [Bacteroidota bacterium]